MKCPFCHQKSSQLVYRFENPQDELVINYLKSKLEMWTPEKGGYPLFGRSTDRTNG